MLSATERKSGRWSELESWNKEDGKKGREERDQEK